MTMTLIYQPGISIAIDDKLLLWQTARQSIRKLLGENFEIADNVVDLSEYYNGDISKNIIQRRDIYKNYKGQDNFFFLNYDSEDRLQEIEIHHGIEININGLTIDFSMNIESVADLLQDISGDKLQLSHGEYLFKKLKLIIASAEAMGGEGNELSYFYCSNDITHLDDN